MGTIHSSEIKGEDFNGVELKASLKELTAGQRYDFLVNALKAQPDKIESILAVFQEVLLEQIPEAQRSIVAKALNQYGSLAVRLAVEMGTKPEVVALSQEAGATGHDVQNLLTGIEK